VDSVPHSWLFPRVAAVVHHGGAGTTAAGLQAGVPSIIIPFFGDQGFWEEHVAKLGVGAKPIPRKQLTAEKLAEAIQQVMTDKAMRQRAANLGARIQAEEGIAGAVAFLGDIGIYMSAGYLSNLLIRDKKSFEIEKNEVFVSGLASSPWQHLDQTGARVAGVNHTTNVICNPLYTAYFTTPSKDRLTVLKVLQNTARLEFMLSPLTYELWLRN
jgi:UDP-glucoronosyl and UDP-glucosyl transferase